VDKVAQIHGATDGVTLLAASSRLTKSAKKWYDIQNGAVIESWSNLKLELSKIFERKLPFYRVMQKAEQRKWLPAKESFDQYAIDKLTLIHQLNLPECDGIHLLIGGINHHSLRASALTVANNTLDVFLEKMRTITGMTDIEKKSARSSAVKHEEITCRNCGKKGHEAKLCKAETVCFYCKAIGHRKFECSKIDKKTDKQGPQFQRAQTAAPVMEVEMAETPPDEMTGELVVLVTEGDSGIRQAQSLVKVVFICNNH